MKPMKYLTKSMLILMYVLQTLRLKIYHVKNAAQPYIKELSLTIIVKNLKSHDKSYF